MLREGFCWVVSNDPFQQQMLEKSIELVKTNCRLPTCVITSDKNLSINVDELIYIKKDELDPKLAFFTRLKHCPWDMINYLSCRTMIINPLSEFINDKQAQFLVRPNIMSPSRTVYPTVKKKWYVNNSWFRISKYHVTPLENWFKGSSFVDSEQPLSEWVEMLSNRTLHQNLWFPSGYRDMHEVRKWIGIEPTKDWLGVPKDLFNLRPIFEISENKHFKEFIKNGF